MLYELIHKKAPYKGRRMEDVKQRIKENRVVFKKDIDAEVRAIIFRMLQMAPKKRPSVSDVLQTPFIRGVRQRMDSRFFVNGARAAPPTPESPTGPGPIFNDFVPAQLQSPPSDAWRKKESPAKDLLVPGKGGNGPQRSGNRSQDAQKRAPGGWKHKFHSSQANQVPGAEKKVYHSSRHLLEGLQPNAPGRGLALNQSDPRGRGRLAGLEQAKLEAARMLGSKKLFQSYNERVFKNAKSKTEPSSLAKGRGPAQVPYSIFSKKKKANTEALRCDSGRQPKNYSGQKEELLYRKGDAGAFGKKGFVQAARTEPSAHKDGDSSKENLRGSGKGQRSEDLQEFSQSGRSNLKKLLKRSQDERTRGRTGSAKKTGLKKTGLSRPKTRVEASRSFNQAMMRKRLGHYVGGLQRDCSRERRVVAHQSMAAPSKHGRSVKYINCDWKAPSSHAKSHSFTDASLKTKLVMRRKDSIQDLKKKLSTRKIESLLQKPRAKGAFLNALQNAQSRADPQRMGLKRTHSMATGLAPKMVKGVKSSGKNPVVQRSLGGVIHHFKVGSFDRRAPVSNVFQLKPKAEKTKSFCFSHRVDNLNAKTIMSKLKGFSQRNMPKVVAAKTNYTQIYQSLHGSSSRYQEPVVKSKFLAHNPPKWRSKFNNN